jgi:hypothetical protein
MPTREVTTPESTWVPKPCRHPSHGFPTMWAPRPGTYTHVCPSCGNRQTIVVAPRATL